MQTLQLIQTTAHYLSIAKSYRVRDWLDYGKKQRHLALNKKIPIIPLHFFDDVGIDFEDEPISYFSPFNFSSNQPDCPIINEPNEQSLNKSYFFYYLTFFTLSFSASKFAQIISSNTFSYSNQPRQHWEKI